MEVIRLGEVIPEYLDDDPFPSRLLLGFVRNRPLHVVVALESSSKNCYVITAYDPNPHLWDEDFKRRRPHDEVHPMQTR